MKKKYISWPVGYVTFLLLLLNGQWLQAQCTNADFATGTFAGWKGTYCLSDSNGYCKFPNPTEYMGFNQGPLNNPPGFQLAQYSHVMCSAAGGNDPNLLLFGVSLPMVKPGNAYSARIGSMWQKVGNNGNGDAETLSYTFLVTQDNCNFIYNYAVVLNDGGHGPNQQPYFNIKVTDSNGGDITCGDLEVDATTARHIGGFDSIDSNQILYRPWTPVWLPLVNYIGQQVTITFTARGCSPIHPPINYQCAGSHYAYAYISAQCGPSGIILSSPSVCGGKPVTLTAPPGAASYAWSGPGVTTPVDSQSVVITQSGRYLVSMATFGDTPCVFTLDTFIAPSPNSPSANFNMPSSVCTGQTATITYTGSASSSAVFNWGFNNGIVTPNSGRGPFHILWDTSGSRLVTLTVSDSGCLSPPDSLPVTIYPTPPSLNYDTTYCSGNSVILGPPATAGYSYLWSPSVALSNPAINDPVISLAATSNNVVTQIYSVLVTDSFGCTNTDTVTITVNPSPVAHFTPPITECTGGTGFNFVADGVYLPTAVFSWSFGANAVPPTSSLPGQHVNYISAGISVVTLTVSQAGSSCQSAFTDSVVVNPAPQAGFTEDTISGCINSQICFINTSSGSDTLISLWSFGDGSISKLHSPCHVYTIPGIYPVSLQVTTPQGCASDTTGFSPIHIFAGPTAAFTANQSTIQQPETEIDFTNLSTNSLTYLWTFGNGVISTETDPIANFTQYGTYHVVLYAYNALGCADSATLPITVLPPQGYFIPNAFTPNGDGINDVFYIDMQEGVTLQSFKVFDRWGEKVHDGLYPWDGTYKGQPCPPAVYVYVAVINLAGSQSLSTHRKGSITLIR